LFVNAKPPAACGGQVLFLSVSARGNRTGCTRCAANFESQQHFGSQTAQPGISTRPIGAYKVVVAANKIFAGAIKGILGVMPELVLLTPVR
jgi:hypothetical protein